jgi:hypothetical protein
MAKDIFIRGNIQKKTLICRQKINISMYFCNQFKKET